MRFDRFLGSQKEPRKIWDATDTDIHRFLSEVGNDVAKTRETRWHAIMQYFKYLLEKTLIEKNPAAAMALAKAPRRSTTLSVLSREEVTRLLNAPAGHVDRRDNPRRAFSLTGLRRRNLPLSIQTSKRLRDSSPLRILSKFD
jgi:site-specific recombinase XerD